MELRHDDLGGFLPDKAGWNIALMPLLWGKDPAMSGIIQLFILIPDKNVIEM